MNYLKDANKVPYNVHYFSLDWLFGKLTKVFFQSKTVLYIPYPGYSD